MPENDEATRREVVDTRNQLIKTTNQVGLLAAEIKELRRLAERHERLLRANSITAYLLFAGLLSGAFWVVYRTRTDRLEAERASYERAQKEADRRLAEAQDEARRREDADGRAFEVYGLLRSGKDREALERYPGVAGLPLGRLEAEVLREGIDRVRGESAHAAYMQGLSHFESGQWRRAAAEFRQSLQTLPEAPWTASLRYHLGAALYRLGLAKEAAPELEQALRLGGDGVGEDASFLLATAYDQLRQRSRAIAEYRQFLARHPAHRLAPAARRRVADLSVR